LVGFWLGLWTICGFATLTSGLCILALQLYGFLHLGFWAHLTPAGILRAFSITGPIVPWASAQKIIDCVLLLPLSAVFIWCGFHIAAMAWIARKNLEKSLQSDVVTMALNERFRALAISSLEVKEK
jgi:hypothetical protein